MLKSDRTELEYFSLMKRAKEPSSSSNRQLRVAILADVSTQHLSPLLRALFASNGVAAVIYEAGFDTVELEAFDPNSGLYSFSPEVVIILQSLGKLKANYYDFPDERGSFVSSKAAQIEQVWKAIRARCGAPIIQSTFVLPYERPFGNYGNAAVDTLHGKTSDLNREICTRARANTGVLINDVDYLAAWAGRRQFIDEKLWSVSKSLCALEFLPDVAQNLVDIALATQGRTIKCVVLDLDNTLWGGVVGDEGLDGIELGDRDETGTFRSFQLYLRELGRRGILLAVCSKNDEAVARRVFQEHPGMVLREADIAAFVANWEDKATNIRRIREKLNIGFDSMVFLDDNPFERNLVRQMLPEVVVPELSEDPELYVRNISELNLFEVAAHSELDLQRAALYREQEERALESSRFVNLDDYLKSLETMARVARFEPRDLGRIAQLLQRSNQFNLTTRRHSEAECEAMMRDEGVCFPFSISVRDRFGDFGLINLVILRHVGAVLEIDTFVMSCRVLQRGVEQLAMNKIFEYARRVGCDRVIGRYIPSPKNGMVKNFYSQFGFERVSSDDAEGILWSLRPSDYVEREVYITEARLLAEQAA
ncbi:MAG TPA: HAD-IIIC family phosphatase [Polyangiaceae bacterium]|nr:HAD-IIIC family phosphatase [Polyangiaceae bacterium]